MLPTDADPVVLSKTWAQPDTVLTRLRAASLSTAEQMTIMAEAIASLLHADADHTVLLSSLLEYRKAIEKLGLKFGNRLVGLMLPPNDEDVELYTKCSLLYTNLAGICQRVIHEAPQELEHSQEIAANVTQACYWAIRFQGERLRYAYCSYTHAPPEIWFQIHQTYQHSLTHGLTNIPVHVDSKLRHITHVYKRVLLFGVCDPYQFPFRSVNGVFQALDDWAKLAHLRSGKPASDKCLFLINPNTDRPAEPMLPNLSLGVDTLYLDTSPLVEVLNLDLNTFEEIGFKNQRQPLRTELETREMLKTLIVSWGIHPPRQSARQRRDDTCELVTSLNSVTALICLDSGQLANSLPQVRNGLQLVDESATGARIRVKRNDKTYVRVGELVAMKSRYSTEWAFGLIRWGQTDTDGDFYLGIYKFIDNATPAWVRHDQERNRSSTGLTTVIWASRKKTEKLTTTLIADIKVYRQGRKIYVEHQGQSSYFEIGEVILSTRYFAWFEITPAEPEPGLLKYLESKSVTTAY